MRARVPAATMNQLAALEQEASDRAAQSQPAMPVEDERTAAANMRRRVLGALEREAFYRGPNSTHASRVTALGRLVAVLGMDVPSKPESEHRGGVIVVPAIADIDEWERVAMAYQLKLVDAARDPVVTQEQDLPDPHDVTSQYKAR